MGYFKIQGIICKVHAFLKKKVRTKFKVILFTDVLMLVIVESVNNT